MTNGLVEEVALVVAGDPIGCSCARLQKIGHRAPGALCKSGENERLVRPTHSIKDEEAV